MKGKAVSNQREILSSVRTELLKHGIDFNEDEIISQNRHDSVVFRRALICYCLRAMGLTTTQIGAIINRDHSTVIHSLKYNPKKNKHLKLLYQTITGKIKSINAVNNLLILEKIKFHQGEIEKLKLLLT